MPTPLLIFCGCFDAIKAELSGCDRNRVVCKAQDTYFWPLIEKKLPILVLDEGRRAGKT